ncbi:MAG: helix-turn-helix transcriptional regulator [Planctomycetota bacterium]
MSLKRQSVRFDVRTLALNVPDGWDSGWHAHEWAQLVYAVDGVLSVELADGYYVIPPLRAAWVPMSAEHRTVATGKTKIRTLYLSPSLVRRRGLDHHRVVAVGPLLRELILRTIECQMLRSAVESESRLAEVILDEVGSTRAAPLDLRLPSDARARWIAERVIRSPGCREPLEVLVVGCGASGRTIERVFRRELGMTFGKWRQRARLLHSLRMLAGGATVAECAHGVGYETPSAYILSFKSHLGETPGRFFATDHGFSHSV